MMRIKHLLKWIKEKTGNTKTKMQNYVNRNFQNSNPGVYWVTMVVLCLIAGIFAYGNFRIPWLASIVAVIATLIVSTVAYFILDVLFHLLLKNGIRNLLYVTTILFLLTIMGIIGCSGNDIVGAICFAIVVGIALVLFGRSFYALCHNKVKSPTIFVTVGVTGAVLFAFLVFMGNKGFTDSYIAKYVDGNKQVQEAIHDGEIEGFAANLENGSYTVATMDYGPDSDTETELRTQTVDLSAYVNEATKINGMYHKLMQKYSVKEAPIAGKVWYPVEASNCPVLFMIHGNHTIATDSYLGYAYLGEHLASHGYVVISVDENILNNLREENDGRAVLLLENIKQFATYNVEEKNPLFRKMNYDKIAIAGHSRGGEAVSIAYLFNHYDVYPENGTKKFDYHFNIQSVIAIAPTVDQYRPADHDVELSDINYLLLQGANDQDICVFMGNTQYKNVTFSETSNKKYIKSSLYIAGVNHGQFNSEWGQFDMPAPLSTWLNVGNFISEKEQQTICKLYTKEFLDTTLLGEDTYRDLFTDYSKYSMYLPKTVYISQYETSEEKVICDFEEDSNLETTTLGEGMIQTLNMTEWSEGLVQSSNNIAGGNHKNNALNLKWNDTKEAEVIFTIPSQNMQEGELLFDICDRNESEISENISNLEVIVILTDGSGQTVSLSTGDYETVYPALPVKLGKVQFLSGKTEYKHQFQTVSLPIHGFITKGVALDQTDICKIRILFQDRTKGDILIDNVCLK